MGKRGVCRLVDDVCEGIIELPLKLLLSMLCRSFADLLYPADFLGRWQVSRQLGDYKTPLGEASVPEDALRRLLAEPKLATYEATQNHRHVHRAA